jgi:hypothetical protein
VQARDRDLITLGEVGWTRNFTLELKVVLQTVVDRAGEFSGADAGSMLYYREEVGRSELGLRRAKAPSSCRSVDDRT